MDWSLWMIFGFVLVVGEVLTAGSFFMMFFAAAAFLTGGLVASDFLTAPGQQWLTFTLTSLALLTFLRRKIVNLLKEGQLLPDEFVGQRMTVTASIPPGAIGFGEHRGTSWRVKNEGRKPLEPGETVEVLGRVGLMLLVTSTGEEDEASIKEALKERLSA